MSSTPGVVSQLSLRAQEEQSLNLLCSLHFPPPKATCLNGPLRSKGRQKPYVPLFLLVVSPLKSTYMTRAASQYYVGKTFKLRISFPSNYPYTAPTVVFLTPCYHPNVAIQGGHICLDILKVCTHRSSDPVPNSVANWRVSIRGRVSGSLTC